MFGQVVSVRPGQPPDAVNLKQEKHTEPLITRAVHCKRCGLPVTLTYQATLVVQSQDWACPYDPCWMLQHLELAGELVDVAKGHRPVTHHTRKM